MLIYTAASGHYKGYAEIWKYFVRVAYPECDLQCDMLNLEPDQCQYYAACYRLLNCPDKSQDCIYTTDVDMIILRESPTIREYHYIEMAASGQPYSNTVRNKEPLGDKRMTGLHFAMREWYERTEKIRHQYLHMLANNEIGRGRFDDELILMQVCQKSKMTIPFHRNLVGRHHGIHLGTVRAYINHSRERLDTELRMRINKEKAAQFVGLWDGMRDLLLRTSPVIKNEMQIVYSFCRRLTNG